jgi:hypothetical protein
MYLFPAKELLNLITLEELRQLCRMNSHCRRHLGTAILHSQLKINFVVKKESDVSSQEAC